MSLSDDACLHEINAKLLILQAAVARHERVIDQQGEVLEKLTSFMSENRPTLREIVEVVCYFYQISPADIRSPSHIQDYAHPRLIIYYLARKLTRLSLQSIAERIGRRDHTTVRTGFLRIARRVRRDEVLRDDIDVLRAHIAERVMERELAVSRGVLMLPPPAVRH